MLNPKMLKYGILGVSLLLSLYILATSAFETVSNEEVIVQQYFTGQVDVHTTAGIHPDFGKSVRYDKVQTLKIYDENYYNTDEKTGDRLKPTLGVPVTYADEGSAIIPTSVVIKAPVSRSVNGEIIDLDSLWLEINQALPNNKAILTHFTDIYAQILGSTAGFFTASESFSQAKEAYLEMALDQLNNGPYKTKVKVENKFEIPGDSSTLKQIEFKVPVKDKDGNFVRIPYNNYGFKFENPIILNAWYDSKTMLRRNAQQSAKQQVDALEDSVRMSVAKTKQIQQEVLQSIAKTEGRERLTTLKTVEKAKRDSINAARDKTVSLLRAKAIADSTNSVSTAFANAKRRELGNQAYYRLLLEQERTKQIKMASDALKARKVPQISVGENSNMSGFDLLNLSKLLEGSK